MAISFVKNIGGAQSRNASSLSVTVPAGGVAQHNILLLRLISNGTTITVSSVVDTQSNSYSALLTSTGTTSPNTWVYICDVGTALVSGNTITVTYSNKRDCSLVVDEFSGITTTTDGTNTATGTSTAPSVAITPATAAALVFASLPVAGGSADSYTEDADNNGGDTWHALTAVTDGFNTKGHGAYKITTSAVTQTYDPTLGTSRFWRDLIAALQSSAPPVTQPYYVRTGGVPAMRIGRPGANFGRTW